MATTESGQMTAAGHAEEAARLLKHAQEGGHSPARALAIATAANGHATLALFEHFTQGTLFVQQP